MLARLTTMTLVAALLLGPAAYAEQFLNAHYEIDVVDHDSRSKVKSTFQLKAGATATIELLPDTVKLSVQPVSDKEYDLLMVITAQRQPGVVLLNKTFRGQFGVPLELHAVGDAVQVEGAISVVVLQRQDPPPKPEKWTGKGLQV